ncbi:MAG TPA: hypothetical protein VKZ53_23440 [Candidatus Angelobacter sp.]|nr:hypothetical protein [Candidatus Angelobacter sp.]
MSLCVFFLVLPAAYGQQLDLGFAMSGLLAPSATSASGNFSPQSIGGGAFPGFNGDFLFRHNFGVGAEVNWRAKQNVYRGFQPFRPILYDFNGVWAPRLGKKASAELQAGIGAASIRFYNPFVTCNFFGCSNFSSSNHFLGHFGGGVRLYVFHNVFIRPEAHYYLIHNNFEFSGANSTRVGITLGYSLRGEQ